MTSKRLPTAIETCKNSTLAKKKLKAQKSEMLAAKRQAEKRLAERKKLQEKKRAESLREHKAIQTITDSLFFNMSFGEKEFQAENLTAKQLSLLKKFGFSAVEVFLRSYSQHELKARIEALESEKNDYLTEERKYQRLGVTLSGERKFNPHIWMMRHPGVINPYASYSPEVAWWKCHAALSTGSPPPGVNRELLNLLKREMDGDDDYSQMIFALKSVTRLRSQVEQNLKQLSHFPDLNYPDNFQSVHKISVSDFEKLNRSEKLGYLFLWASWLSRTKGRKFIKTLTDALNRDSKKGASSLKVYVHSGDEKSNKSNSFFFRLGKGTEIHGPPPDIFLKLLELSGYRISSKLSRSGLSITVTW